MNRAIIAFLMLAPYATHSQTPFYKLDCNVFLKSLSDVEESFYDRQIEAQRSDTSYQVKNSLFAEFPMFYTRIDGSLLYQSLLKDEEYIYTARDYLDSVAAKIEDCISHSKYEEKYSWRRDHQVYKEYGNMALLAYADGEGYQLELYPIHDIAADYMLPEPDYDAILKIVKSCGDNDYKDDINPKLIELPEFVENAEDYAWYITKENVYSNDGNINLFKINPQLSDDYEFIFIENNSPYHYYARNVLIGIIANKIFEKLAANNMELVYNWENDEEIGFVMDNNSVLKISYVLDYYDPHLANISISITHANKDFLESIKN